MRVFLRIIGLFTFRFVIERQTETKIDGKTYRQTDKSRQIQKQTRRAL